MTNNIEQTEGYYEYNVRVCLKNNLDCAALAIAKKADQEIFDLFSRIKSMQSQIDALTKEADADESRESESL